MLHKFFIGCYGYGKMEATRKMLGMSQEEFMEYYQKQQDAAFKVKQLEQQLTEARREYYASFMVPLKNMRNVDEELNRVSGESR